jgi:hypothetical protein
MNAERIAFGESCYGAPYGQVRTVGAVDASTASWHKSSWSSYNGSCVEVAELPASNLVAIRDTKQKGIGPVLAFTRSEWDSFLSKVKNDELNF